MPGIRKRGEEIRDFILLNITDNKNIASLTSKQFDISLPAVYKHIDRLVLEKQLVRKKGRYILKSKQSVYEYKIDNTLTEDAAWEKDIKKHFTEIPQNVLRIWVYGFLEIFNNALEHSKGKKISVIITEDRVSKTISIADDGIGIFKNIKSKYNLIDEKEAFLELTKGKRTTDTKRHSGQGIFFTSKMFDDYFIISNGLIFNTNQDKKPELTGKNFSTNVIMRLSNNSTKTTKEIFDQFSTESPGDFDKTIVPIHFANSNDLVSRSQARRILSGLELFREVTLDFMNVEYIGQAFADEIFRVFVNMNPEIVILTINANDDVKNMINRAVKTRLSSL